MRTTSFYQCCFLTAMLLTCILGEGREDWIDPNDMLNYDPSSNRMLKKDNVRNVPSVQILM